MPANITAANGPASRSRGADDPVRKGAGLPPGEVEGCIDAIEGDRLYGWAWKPARPDETVRLALYVDGEKVADFAADRERADLAANGVGDGRHAFEYRSTDGKGLLGRNVEVRIAGEDAALPLQAQAASAVTMLGLVNRIARLERAVIGLAERDRENQAVLIEMKGQVAAARRDVEQHDLAIFRQDATLKSKEDQIDAALANYRNKVRRMYFTPFCLAFFVLGFVFASYFLGQESSGLFNRETLPEWALRWFG